MKKATYAIFLAELFATFTAFAEVITETKFREPFVLKLRIEGDKLHKQAFGKIPYVYKNNVFLFAGEKFGINIEKSDKGKFKVTYAKNVKNADIQFNFDQRQIVKTTWGMVLITKNNTKKTVKYKVLMTRPGLSGVYSTKSLPIKPGLANYEHWPHPILQLVVTEIRMH